nr:putative glutathione-specific gamma-glutamylcyclotransferase 2 [Quercus suber]
MSVADKEANDLWLFGYGLESSGIYRRLCSALLAGKTAPSNCEAGIPESRMLSIIHICRQVWGAAYRIPSPHVAAVKEYLDIREINGYSIQYTPFTPAEAVNGELSQDNINCLVYIGLPENPQFLGPQDPQTLAEHIVRSRGPSGENKEYLYQLEAALDGLSQESSDEHITDLARRCRQAESGLYPGAAPGESADKGDTVEQAETEKRSG